MNHVRLLAESEIQNLSSLFAKERAPQSGSYYWQDRSPDFLKAYHLFQSGPARYLGISEGLSWVGSSGAIPVSVNFAEFQSQMSLDTDLMVDPDKRSRSLGRDLVQARVEDYHQALAPTTLLWGVEQVPQSLQICQHLMRKKNGDFAFPWKTTLTHVFLTGQPHQKEFAKVGLLREASTEFRTDFIREYQRCNLSHLFSARLSPEIFQRILDVDSEAIWIRTDRAGCILFSGTLLKQFRYTGKTNLLLERIRRRRQVSSLKDEYFNFGFFSLSWHQEGSAGELSSVLHQAVEESYRKKWDCLALRDEPVQEVDRLSPDVLAFERRVFLVYSENNPECERIKDFLAGSMPTSKIEVSLL
jgi:hypothetical protein